MMSSYERLSRTSNTELSKSWKDWGRTGRSRERHSPVYKSWLSYRFELLRTREKIGHARHMPVPCALFAIGVSLVRINAPLSSAIVALPVSGKLLLHPLIAWLIMSAFNIDTFAKTVAVLTAALPTAGWAFILAQRYDADASRVSAVILFTTALSFATVSGLVWWLQITL